jgi:hypothetical protein
MLIELPFLYWFDIGSPLNSRLVTPSALACRSTGAVSDILSNDKVVLSPLAVRCNALMLFAPMFSFLCNVSVNAKHKVNVKLAHADLRLSVLRVNA